jgi:hypothetical protein
MAQQVPIVILEAAARGETKALANWIELNRTVDGVPFQLIAELIRNSSGCKKTVSVLEDECVIYDEDTNEFGEPQRYIKSIKGYVKHMFHPPGGMKDQAKSYRENKMILKEYLALKGRKPREVLLHDLGIKYHKSPTTIKDIIADTRERIKKSEEMMESLGIHQKLNKPQ